MRVRATTLSRHDLHIYKWDPWARSRFHPPMIFGHEFWAMSSPSVDRSRDDQGRRLYLGRDTIVCGHCYPCRTGDTHICRNSIFIGVDRAGLLRAIRSMPAGNAWLNDPKLPPAIAAAQDPFGNAATPRSPRT